MDYGYSLETLFKGQVDSGLIKVNGKQMRKFGFTQISLLLIYMAMFFYLERLVFK